MSSSVLVDRISSRVSDRIDLRTLAGSLLIEVAILYAASYVVLWILLVGGGQVEGVTSFKITFIARHAVSIMVVVAFPIRLAAGVATYLRRRLL